MKTAFFCLLCQRILWRENCRRTGGVAAVVAHVFAARLTVA